MLTALLIPLVFAAVIYALTLVRTALARRAAPGLEAIVLGAITNFFDTLGVGSFDQYPIPLHAYVKAVDRAGERLEIQADVESIEKAGRSYKIVREPFRPQPPTEKTREPLTVHWVVVDAEHSPFNPETLHHMLLAFKGSPTVPLIRVPWNDHVVIKQALDMGWDGVLIPQVNTVEEVKRAVEACRYPPQGRRGFGPRRAGNYYRDQAEYTPRNVQTLDQRSDQFFGVKVRVEPSPELKAGMSALVRLAEDPAVAPVAGREAGL